MNKKLHDFLHFLKIVSAHSRDFSRELAET